MSTALILALAAAALCFSVVAAFVLFLVMTSGGSDPYKDLPTTPPRVHPMFQDMINDVWATKSNCWHFNHWVRVTLTDALVAMQVDVPALLMQGAKADVSNKAYMDYVARTYYPLYQKSYKALQKCDPKATFTDKGKNVPISELQKMFEFGNLSYPDFRVRLERVMRGQ